MTRRSMCILVPLFLACPVLAATPPVPPFAPSLPNLSPEARRGEHLVAIGGCHDCHTPKTFGPQGPVPDMTRMLSGHPEGIQVSGAPTVPGWIVFVNDSLTAHAGPWGTSFSANLTPDTETGLGGWTEQNFIEAMRTGRHMGRGRPILPPMPWIVVAQHSDAELKAIWAYLRRVPPIRNEVPAPRPPSGAATPAATTR